MERDRRMRSFGFKPTSDHMVERLLKLITNYLLKQQLFVCGIECCGFKYHMKNFCIKLINKFVILCKVENFLQNSLILSTCKILIKNRKNLDNFSKIEESYPQVKYLRSRYEKITICCCILHITLDISS